MTAHPPFTLLHGGLQGRRGRDKRAPAPWLPPPACQAAAAALLGEFASLLLLAPAEAGASKAAELDRELLACCAEAIDVDRETERIMDLIDCMEEDDPALLTGLYLARPLVAEYDDAVTRAAKLPARTPEGLRAKAGLLRGAHRERGGLRGAGGQLGAGRGGEGVMSAASVAPQRSVPLPLLEPVA